MKKAALALAFIALLAGNAHATTTTKPASAQQNRMKSCAAQYHQKGIAKSQYHSFMSSCLKTHPSTASAKTPKSGVTPASASSTASAPAAAPSPAPVSAAPASSPSVGDQQ